MPYSYPGTRRQVRIGTRSRLAGKLPLFLALVAWAPFVYAQAPGKTPAPNHPLNIILVIRDQTRYDLPIAAGYQMPALDRLAQQGVVFRNHYVASAMCTPSRAALFTRAAAAGQRRLRPDGGGVRAEFAQGPAQHGFLDEEARLPDGIFRQMGNGGLALSLPSRPSTTAKRSSPTVSTSTSLTGTKPARPTRATRPTFTPRPKASAGCGAMCPSCGRPGSRFS